MKSTNETQLIYKYYMGECTQKEIDYLFELAIGNEQIRNDLLLSYKLRNLGKIKHWENSQLPSDAIELLKQYEREGIGEPQQLRDPEIIKIVNDNIPKPVYSPFSKTYNSFRLIKIVFIILLFITAGFLISYLIKAEDSDLTTPMELFEKHIAHDPNKLALKGETDFQELKQGLTEYYNKNYIESANLLLIHFSKYSKDLESSYYLGRCYLHLHQPIKAIEIFQLIIEKTNPSDFQFYQDSKLSLGLAYLLNNDTDSAIKVLRDIENQNKTAKVILTKLQYLD